MKATNKVKGHWVEYEEKPFGHGTGYYWLRDDGIRFGLRMAGRYYRPDTVPQPPKAAMHPWDMQRQGMTVPCGAAHDGAMGIDVLGGMREEAKKEQLPTHLRVMREGREIELISEIDGKSIDVMLDDENWNPWTWMDERFPHSTKRVKSV